MTQLQFITLGRQEASNLLQIEMAVALAAQDKKMEVRCKCS